MKAKTAIEAGVYDPNAAAKDATVKISAKKLDALKDRIVELESKHYQACVEGISGIKKLQAENAELKEKNMALSKQTAQASCLANEAIEHAKTVSKKLGIAKDALLWAYEMFLHRDHMNAKVHCAPERLSPITERCKTALASLESKIKGEAK